MLCWLSGEGAYAQIVVSENLTPEELVTNIFAGSNSVITNITYTGAASAIGSFSAPPSTLGLEAGILLTTGIIQNAIGPNIDSNRTNENGGGSDIDLAKAYSYTQVIRDAAVLEFDFYSYADRVTFEYVFASEEYPEYVGSIYNDIFGFFISGPGYTGNENIALIPGTPTPVSINSINPQVNSKLYVNNKGGNLLEYDGFTTVLTAEANVVPCETYHLKLAIADVSDRLYDSGVFLKAKSFETGSSVYIGDTKNAVESCGMGYFMLVRVGRTNYGITYHYTVSGTASSGTDYISLGGQYTFKAEQDTGYIYVEALDDGLYDPGETVMITLRNNCGYVVDTASITIAEADNFTITVTGDTTCCIGTPVQLDAYITGGTGPFEYFWEPAQLSGSTVNLSPNTSTVYYLTVTDSSTGCSVHDSILVQVFNTEVYAGDDVYLCPGGESPIGNPATGGHPPYRYQWEPVTGLSAADVPIPLAHPTTTTLYMVTATDALGCTDTDTITVTVSDLAVNHLPDDTICWNSSARYTVFPTGGTPPYHYRWEPATGVSDTNAYEPVVSPPFTTQYTVFVADNAGCIVKDSFTVLVDPGLIADAGDLMRVCPGAPVRLGRQTTGGTPPYRYEWSPPDNLNDPTIANPTLTPIVSQTYQLRVTDAHGCISEDVVTVQVDRTVVAEAGRDTVTCQGRPVQLLGSVSGGAPPYTFLWSPGDAIGDSLTLSPWVHPDTTTTYYLTVLDSVGCVDLDSVTITVDNLPNVSIIPAGALTVCAPDSVTLHAEPGYARYLWSTGDTASTIVLHASGTLGLQAYTADGCVAYSDSITVTINAVPEGTIYGPASVCHNSSSVYYYEPVLSGVHYEWNVQGGTIVGTASNTFTVAWGGTSPGTVSLTITDVKTYCTQTIDYPVEISSRLLPVISFAGDSIRCMGDSVVLNAGLGYAQYLWSTGDTTQSITVTGSGIYTVTVSDSSGCSGTSAPVTILFHDIVIPAIDISGDPVICEGDSITLRIPDQYLTYEWSTGDTGPECVVRKSGTYTVTVTDSLGCIGTTAPMTITEISLPDNTISGPEISCAGVEASYSAASVPGLSYKWNSTGGTITSSDTLPDVTVRWDSEGTGILTLDISLGSVTCSALYRISVDIVQNFTFPIIARDGLTFCADSGVTLEAPTGFRNYRWSTGDTTSTIFVRSPGSYWVRIQDSGGCQGESDTVVTSVLPSPAAVIEPLGATAFCEGDSTVIQSQFEHPVYRWSTGDTTRSIIVTQAGAYTLTVTNASGCSATSSPLQINIDSNPTPVIAGIRTACRNAIESYTTPETAGNTYIWMASGGDILSGEGTHTIEIQWTDPGTTIIELLERTPAGCFAWASPVNVTVFPTPHPAVTRSGDTLYAQGFESYQWQRGGTDIAGETAPYIEMSMPGTYTVRVIDSNGCSGVSDGIVYAPSASSTIGLPCITGFPGERIQIPVVVTEKSGYFDDVAGAFSGTLSVNASVLYPAGSTPAGLVHDGKRTIPVSGTKSAHNDTLALLDFTAMLGNAASSPLELTTFAWDNPSIAITTVIGTFELDICHEGGDRLFYDTGILQLDQNTPNPYNASTVINFELIEEGRTRLVVIDMLGRETAVILDRTMTPGQYSVYFDASALPSGSYIYELQTPTARIHRTMKLMK